MLEIIESGKTGSGKHRASSHWIMRYTELLLNTNLVSYTLFSESFLSSVLVVTAIYSLQSHKHSYTRWIRHPFDFNLITGPIREIKSHFLYVIPFPFLELMRKIHITFKIVKVKYTKPDKVDILIFLLYIFHLNDLQFISCTG